MDEYTITINGPLRGCAIQVTDPDDTIVAEANDLDDSEVVEWVAAWLRENVL